MTDFKKDTRTAEEQSREMYRMPEEANSGFEWYDDACDKALRKRTGYAACITEQVTPRDEFIAELVVAMGKLRKAVKRAPFTVLMDCDNLLTKARDRGYTL